MDNDMLAQIQQMITTTTDSLRAELTGIATGLNGKLAGLGQHVTGLDGKVTELGHRVAGVDEKVVGLDQRVTGLDGKLAELGHRVTGVDGKVVGLDQRMTSLAGDLREEVADTKRHTGVLVEGLRHELQLVAEGLQMHIEQRHQEDRAYMDKQFRETRTLIQLTYTRLNERVTRLEQRGN